MADLLEQIWLQAINLDPTGAWIERSFKKLPPPLHAHYRACAPALQRLQKLNLAEDLGRLSRFVRYEGCFGLLYSLDDPGLTDGEKLHPNLITTALTSSKKKPTDFLVSLRENLCVDSDSNGEWMHDLAKQKKSEEPFNDAGTAAKNLLKAGASPDDLAQLVLWSRYEAAAETFRLLHESGAQYPDDLCGLYVMLLGTDPSGQEGRPGSWPIPVKETKPAQPTKETKLKTKTTTTAAAQNPNQPLWKIRSGQTIAFSPDSQTIAIGGASGPARLHDAETGEEIVACDGIKAHIYRLAFSPDGQRLAIADIRERLTICDATTGQAIAKTKFADYEISDLEYNLQTGDLLRSSWSPAIDVLDPKTAKLKEPITPDPGTCMVYALQFFQKGSRLLALWIPKAADKLTATIWSWPDREKILSFELPGGFFSAMAIAPDSTSVAVATIGKASQRMTLRIFDLVSGKRLEEIPFNTVRAMAYTPDGTLITSDDQNLVFYARNSWKPRRQIADAGGAFQIRVSPNGQYLALAKHGGVTVWKL